MVFERLAGIVIRRKKIIITAWIVALVVSIPLAMRVDTVLEYQGIHTREEKSEVDRVNDIISEEFAGSVPNSTAIIVIQGSNVRSSDVKGFVYALESRLETPENEGDRAVYLDNVTSVYTVAEIAVNTTVNATSSTLYMIEDQASQFSIMLYLPIDMFWFSWGEVQNTSQLIYGIPTLYRVNWDSAQGNITERDEKANSSTVAYLDNMLKNASKDERDLAFGYYYTFYHYWCLNRTTDSRGRAVYAINKAVPEFASTIDNETMRDVFLDVWRYFTIDDWGSITKLSGFTYNMVKEILISSFGSQFGMISGYYDSMVSSWNKTFDTHPGITPRNRADLVVNISIPAYISSLSKDMRGFASSIYAWFNLSNYMNAAQRSRFVLEYYTGMSGLSRELVAGVYQLGRNITQKEISNFSRTWVLQHDLDHLGIPLPEGSISQFISPDNTTMRVIISFTHDAGYIAPDGATSVSKDVKTIRRITRETADTMNLHSFRVYVTGDAAFVADIERIADEDLKLIEPITFIAIVIMISIFFYSVATPWLPLGAVGVALGVSQGILFLVGFLMFKINYTVLTFLFSVLMAVGTDYAIFLIARFREEMLFGRSKEEAVRQSLIWAGESVVTSGGTVMISFMVLAFLSSSTIVRAIGLTIGLGVAISIAIALTFVPVIMLYFGDKLFWPSSGKRFKRLQKRFLKRHRMRKGYFYRAAEKSITHAPLIVIICILISVPATYIFFTESTSYDFIAAMPGSESKDGLDAMGAGFGQGEIFPTYIILRGSSPVITDRNLSMPVLWAVENLSAEILQIDNVKKVTSPTRPFGTPLELVKLADPSHPEHDALIPLVKTAIGKDNSTILITVIFKDEPLSHRSLDTSLEVSRVAREFVKNDTALSGMEIMIGGLSASVIEDHEISNREFGFMEIVVIAGIFVIMLIVLGSIALAITSILTIAMSISWSFAATMILFQETLNIPVHYLVSLILFVILMGIGMDYNVFILTRIREEVSKSQETKKAVARAVEMTGGIITALALIMGCALGVLMISNTVMLRQFGFALFAAILIDAMIVRTYLVPAIISLLGKWAWWAPGRLQRVRPKE